MPLQPNCMLISNQLDDPLIIMAYLTAGGHKVRIRRTSVFIDFEMTAATASFQVSAIYETWVFNSITKDTELSNQNFSYYNGSLDLA